jgi:hypothetical protein
VKENVRILNGMRFSNPSLVDFALIIYHLPVGCLDCFPVVYCMAENVFGWRKVI